MCVIRLRVVESVYSRRREREGEGERKTLRVISDRIRPHESRLRDAAEHGNSYSVYTSEDFTGIISRVVLVA